MERVGKIIRGSIYTLLKDFQYFNIPAILLLPFSASILLSQSVYQAFSQRTSLFHHSRIGFLDLNLSRMIFSCVFSLPFALSSLVTAKASIIQSLNHHKPSDVYALFCSSLISLCKPMALTYLCNIIIFITINTAVFSLLFATADFVEELFGLSSNNPLFVLAAGSVFYLSFTNTMVVCNLALVMAGMDGGRCSTVYEAIQKAFFIRKGRKSMALFLALPINLGFCAVESLFRYRVLRAYDLFGRATMSMVMEVLLISYLFSLLIVLDTIACCLFIRSCGSN